MPRFLTVLSVVAFITSPGCRTIDDDVTKVGVLDQSTFATIDQDSDGKVSIEEMATFKHAEGLAEINLNDDKDISMEEWIAAKPSAGENDKQFRFLDANKDRVISEEEAVSFITSNEKFRLSFTELDANEDGSLVWEEYEKLAPEALDVLITEGVDE